MSRPTRVLYFMPTFVTGGAERLVSDFVQRLDPHRFHASVCVFENGPLGEDLEQRGYTVHRLGCPTSASVAPLGRIANMCERIRRLRALMSENRVEILHTHFLGPLLHGYFSRSAGRRWRWVHTEHVRPDLMIPEYYPRWLVRVAPWLLAAADCVTAVAPGVGDYLLETARLPGDRVRVIPNGIDVERFARPYNPLAVRMRLGIPGGAWVVGTVANFRPQKNHQMLLHAFRSVLRAEPDAWLILAGDGQLRSSLEALARDLGIDGRVSFLGARLDAPEVFAAMDVYCLPSLFEGMPLTLFEAMASRRPIVGSAAVGIRELVVDGSTGLLVPINDEEALARALVRVRREPDLAATLVQAAWRYVDIHARFATMLDRYCELYDVLSGRRKGT